MFIMSPDCYNYLLKLCSLKHKDSFIENSFNWYSSQIFFF